MANPPILKAMRALILFLFLFFVLNILPTHIGLPEVIK